MVKRCHVKFYDLHLHTFTTYMNRPFAWMDEWMDTCCSSRCQSHYLNWAEAVTAMLYECNSNCSADRFECDHCHYYCCYLLSNCDYCWHWCWYCCHRRHRYCLSNYCDWFRFRWMMWPDPLDGLVSLNWQCHNFLSCCCCYYCYCCQPCCWHLSLAYAVDYAAFPLVAIWHVDLRTTPTMRANFSVCTQIHVENVNRMDPLNRLFYLFIWQNRNGT